MQSAQTHMCDMHMAVSVAGDHWMYFSREIKRHCGRQYATFATSSSQICRRVCLDRCFQSVTICVLWPVMRVLKPKGEDERFGVALGVGGKR